MKTSHQILPGLALALATFGIQAEVANAQKPEDLHVGTLDVWVATRTNGNAQNASVFSDRRAQDTEGRRESELFRRI